MNNLLSIPFKKTRPIPIRQAIEEYIHNSHPDTHPEAFKGDINQWEELRKAGVGGVVHPDRIQSMTQYHAQLVFISTKLPNDIGLEIPYYPMFNDSTQPLTLRNLTYERAAVLFNLGALHCQLGLSEDRASPQGLKKAIACFQNAAGTFAHLLSSALPSLQASLASDTLLLELSSPVLTHFENLMLAQAQECVWQRAIMEHVKHGLLAKLSAKVSAFYADALKVVQEADPSAKNIFPVGWLHHVEAKRFHFEGVAHFRKSMEDGDARKYGDEIAHLHAALAAVKKACDAARRSGVSKAVVHDAKSLLEVVQKELTRAERDNDLIYHKDVPAVSDLPAIPEIKLVGAIGANDLREPRSVVPHGETLFGELVSWGVKAAINIYNERREDWLKEEVIQRAQHLDDAAIATLRSLNLPATLDALERPIGLPPSLLKKAEEVKTDNGPARIESSIENVRKLSQRAMHILDEAMDILDQEVDEDEAFRNDYSVDRLSSQEANQELAKKGERYRNILTQAADSDATVRRTWEEWETNILELTWDAADLEAAVPSSTVSRSTRSNPSGPNLTQTHARALRALLENLDNVQRARSEIVNAAKRQKEWDDITPRILKDAAAFEQWVEVKPEMLEDTLEQGLSAYEKFRTQLEESEQKQMELLQSIQDRNTSFLSSRKDDPVVKEREHALQSLDLAYHKYKEIARHLDEGLTFYNDFSNIMTQFKEACKAWVNMRRDEILDLTRSMQSVSLENASNSPHHTVEYLSNNSADVTGLPPPANRTHRIALDLPAPDSGEWEATSLPPAPKTPANKGKTPKKTR